MKLQVMSNQQYVLWTATSVWLGYNAVIKRTDFEMFNRSIFDTQITQSTCTNCSLNRNCTFLGYTNTGGNICITKSKNKKF